MYDVEGSIAGIESLESREVSLVHEMGTVLFSERVTFTVRRALSGDILQSTSFNAVLTNLPRTPTRLLAVTVLSDQSTRIANLAVLVRSSRQEREIPVWVADVAGGTVDIRLEDDRGGVTTFNIWQPLAALTQLPSYTGGIDQPQSLEQIALRGTTSGFGAGTVEVTALYHIEFTDRGGIGSKGLPIPS